jgi:hypothetical protein
LQNGFGEPFGEESQFWGNNFGQQLWGTALGSSFGEQLWGSFGQLSGIILKNTCFEEQQLLATHFQGISENKFY